MSVTKAELAKLARHHLDIMGVAWLPDTSATRFSLYDALDWGLRDYYKAVECGPCTLGLTTVIDRGVYHHSAFGAVAEDLDAILPWELDAGPIVPANLLEPGLTIADRVLVTISVQNRTGIAANGNWEAYVVIGEGYGSVPLTETITFTSGAPGTDLFGVGDQAIVTHTTKARFLRVTAITGNGMQGANWFRAVGVGAEVQGARLFKITNLLYDGDEVAEVSEGELRAAYPAWRTDSSGTPGYWAGIGDNLIQVHPAPDSALLLSAYGYSLPDIAGQFALGTDVVPVEDESSEVVAIGAAIRVIKRSPTPEMQARYQLLLPDWTAGIREAKARVHGTGTVEVGKYAGQIGTAGLGVSFLGDHYIVP